MNFKKKPSLAEIEGIIKAVRWVIDKSKDNTSSLHIHECCKAHGEPCLTTIIDNYRELTLADFLKNLVRRISVAHWKEGYKGVEGDKDVKDFKAELRKYG